MCCCHAAHFSLQQLPTACANAPSVSAQCHAVVAVIKVDVGAVKVAFADVMIASCAIVCSTANAWSTTFACATISPVTVASAYVMQEVGVTSFAASRLHVLVWLLHGCS